MQPENQKKKIVLTVKKKSEGEDNSLNLSQTLSGLYLESNHAKMIWQGNKELIVQGLNYKNSVGNLFYLISNNECYGILKINAIRQISLNAFNKLAEKHRITEQERKKWWAGKKNLYAYVFEFVKKFDLPKRVKIEGDKVKTFIDKVEFLSDEDFKVEPMQSFELMEPTKIFIDEKELLDYLYGGV